MNDFLQNLRRAKDKRYNKNRRPYDDNQYNTNQDNRPLHHRKKPMKPNVGDNYSGGYNDTISAIKTHLETLITMQRRVAAADEKRAAAEERIATALERIVQSDIFRNSSSDAKEASPEPEMESVEMETAEMETAEMEAASFESEDESLYAADEADDALEAKDDVEESDDAEDEVFETQAASIDDQSMDRDSVMTLIKSMRERDLSYANIAYELENMGIPTFSGKGKWRGQTVHRLFQQTN